MTAKYLVIGLKGRHDVYYYFSNLRSANGCLVRLSRLGYTVGVNRLRRPARAGSSTEGLNG